MLTIPKPTSSDNLDWVKTHKKYQMMHEVFRNQVDWSYFTSIFNGRSPSTLGLILILSVISAYIRTLGNMAAILKATFSSYIFWNEDVLITIETWTSDTEFDVLSLVWQ